MPCIYNETLHDKTGSFLASVSANITQLSDGAIDDIRRLFPKSNTLAAFCRAYVPSMTTRDIDRILDQVYPEPQSQTFLYIDDDGEERLNDISTLRS